jgi:ribonuclease P protein component
MTERPTGELPLSPPVEGSCVRDERLSRAETLRKSADYLRSYRKGRRIHGSVALLYTHPNDTGRPRLGITASRKVGKANVRNRLKRRIREVYRRFKGRGQLPPIDLVVHLKPEARKAEFDELRRELLRLFSMAGRRG